MLTRILDWVAGKEPVATATGLAALVTAGLGVAASFGLDITPEQIAAIGALAAALAGYLGRRVVSPVMTPDERKVDRMLTRQPTVADDSGQLGILIGIMVVLVLAMVGLFAICGDEDDESLGRQVVASHDYERDRCYDEYDCGEGDRYGDGRGGYSGGPSGGYYEGGKGGSDYDGDGDGNRCRNFCFYGIPAPGEGGRA